MTFQTVAEAQSLHCFKTETILTNKVSLNQETEILVIRESRKLAI